MIWFFIFSVSHPFLGDYVRLRQNVQWKKMSLENNDQYVVFADIINKIARSSGKVSLCLKRQTLFPIFNNFSSVCSHSVSDFYQIYAYLGPKNFAD